MNDQREGSRSRADENVPNVNGTLEETLAKYLSDFAIEDNMVIGYISDLDTFKEILEKMKIQGFAFSVRDSDVRQKRKGKKVGQTGEENECEEKEESNHLTVFYQLRAMPIKFFGLPFTIERTTHYQCAYGCKYYKSRAGLSKVKSPDNNDELKPVKKKRKVGSKKMGCLARMTIKHITVYPEYELDVETDWRKKKKLIENLRRDLLDDKKSVKHSQRFYLSVSVQSSHNHPPIIIMPKPKKPKTKSHRVLVKHKFKKNNESPPNPAPAPAPVNGNEWGYTELATPIPTPNLPPEDKTVATNVQQHKPLNLQDENFFHTLVKFPNTPAVYEQVEYKPVEIEIEMNQYEPGEVPQTIEVYEYQPSIQDLQTLFKEKLKRLYTLSGDCSNAALLLRLAGDLEQVELQLSNDLNYSNL